MGSASALVENDGDLFVLMWAKRTQPSVQFLLYSTTAGAWTSVPPGSFPVSGMGFALPGQMDGFGVAGSNSVYAYVPTTVTAYVIPMSCVSVNAPAVATMSAVNQSGAALDNNDTVFLGDQVTITPSVVRRRPASALWSPVVHPAGNSTSISTRAPRPTTTVLQPARACTRRRTTGCSETPPLPPAQITVVSPL